MINLSKHKDFYTLVNVELKEHLPQVGSYILDYKVKEDKIYIDKENEWLDIFIKFVY